MKRFLVCALLLLPACSVQDKLASLNRFAARLPVYEQMVAVLIEQYVTDPALKERLLSLLRQVQS